MLWWVTFLRLDCKTNQKLIEWSWIQWSWDHFKVSHLVAYWYVWYHKTSFSAHVTHVDLSSCRPGEVFFLVVCVYNFVTTFVTRLCENSYNCCWTNLSLNSPVCSILPWELGHILLWDRGEVCYASLLLGHFLDYSFGILTLLFGRQERISVCDNPVPAICVSLSRLFKNMAKSLNGTAMISMKNVRVRHKCVDNKEPSCTCALWKFH